jgi:hypothetical protein
MSQPFLFSANGSRLSLPTETVEPSEKSKATFQRGVHAKQRPRAPRCAGNEAHEHSATEKQKRQAIKKFKADAQRLRSLRCWPPASGK